MNSWKCREGEGERGQGERERTGGDRLALLKIMES